MNVDFPVLTAPTTPRYISPPLLLAMFLIGTVYPVKFKLTRDPTTSTYGIFKTYKNRLYNLGWGDKSP